MVVSGIFLTTTEWKQRRPKIPPLVYFKPQNIMAQAHYRERVKGFWKISDQVRSGDLWMAARAEGHSKQVG